MKTSPPPHRPRPSLAFMAVLAVLALIALGLFFFADADVTEGISGGGRSSPTTPTTTAPPPEPEPIGAEAYGRLLRRLAGQAIDAPTLERRAREAAGLYEARLQDIAAELGSEDWRTLFARLESEHPVDRDAVLEAYRREIIRQRAFLAPLGLFPAPDRAIRVVANDNPIFRRYFSLAMYLDGQLAVTLEPAEESSDENYLVNHCWICIPPLVAHEVAPGHHVAYSRVAALIPNEAERLVANRSHVIYHEGWGLYAEHLMLELGYYQDAISRGDLPPKAFELGALRLLYFRALRAQVDPAIHRLEITPEEAIAIYQRDAGLSRATAEAEVARHLKDPVLKASYFIGLEQILELRRLVLGQERDAEQLRAFHDGFLGHPRPIPEIASQVFHVELGAFDRGNSPG